MTPPRRGAGWRGWGLYRRLAGALATAGVLLLAVVAASAVVLVRVQESQRHLTDDYYRVGLESRSAFTALVDSETAIRGYALTGDPRTLAPLEASGNPWATPLLPRVRSWIPEAGDTLALLNRFDAAAARWYAEWGQQAVVTVRETGGLPAAEVERGRDLFDEVRTTYSAYIDSVQEGREAAERDLRAATALLFGATITSALIAITTALSLWVLLQRWVARPVRRLADEARVVADGDLGHVVQAEGPPEFAALAGDVEAMRRRLVDTIEELERAGREVAVARALLEHQAEELRRSNRELEQFAYVASHDLQEPLRKVASFCQMLQRRYAGQLDERADQYILFAVDGARRMQQLINDLLEFSRVGRLAAPPVQVDLEDCLATALGNLAAAVEETGAVVTHDPMPRLRGEAPLLTQLLQNLVGNAIKFRAEGRPPRVHLSARRDGDCWELACSDNGIGIAPEYSDRVFLIFQRLHPKEQYGGTGIGLAMCRKIVEHHGGRIWVDQGARAGTTIRWTLPLRGPAPGADDGTGTPPEGAGATATTADVLTRGAGGAK